MPRNGSALSRSSEGARSGSASVTSRDSGIVETT